MGRLESGRASKEAGDCPSHSAGSQTGAGEVGHCWQDSKHQARWGSSMGSSPGDLNTFSLSIAGKKQTLLQSRIPGAPLHTRDHYLPYRDACSRRRQAVPLETSRPGRGRKESTSPQGDVPIPGPSPEDTPEASGPRATSPVSRSRHPRASRQTRTGEVPRAWHHRRPAGRQGKASGRLRARLPPGHPAAPLQQLLLPSFPLDTYPSGTHLRRPRLFLGPEPPLSCRPTPPSPPGGTGKLPTAPTSAPP